MGSLLIYQCIAKDTEGNAVADLYAAIPAASAQNAADRWAQTLAGEGHRGSVSVRAIIKDEPDGFAEVLAPEDKAVDGLLHDLFGPKGQVAK
jgi:hypothetical protein